MDDPEDGFEKLLSECRLAVRACVCGLILAWALTSTLKWADRMPAHLSWAGILVGPATFLVAIGSCFASVLWLGHRWWMAYLPVLLLCCAAMLARMWAERGYSQFWTTWGWIQRTRMGAQKGSADPVHSPNLGRAIPIGTPTIPLVGGYRFLLRACGSDKERSRPPGDRDRSLSLPFAPANPAGSLPFAPTNLPKSLLFAPSSLP
jgi:hypothetical protein